VINPWWSERGSGRGGDLNILISGSTASPELIHFSGEKEKKHSSYPVFERWNYGREK